MKSRAITQALAITIVSLTVTAAGAQQNKGLFPEIVDASHATGKATAFFHSFFTAKSRHDVDATMHHFSRTTLTYMDATTHFPHWVGVEVAGSTAELDAFRAIVAVPSSPPNPAPAVAPPQLL